MLALIAGRGALPGAVAAAQPVPPLVCALDGHVPDGLTPDMTFTLETLGTLLARLERAGVSEVCFCGAIDRPAVDPARFDALTLPLLPLLTSPQAAGEDSALRLVMDLFATHGMAARAAHDLAPDLVLPAGQPTRAQAPAQAQADVARALRVLAEQGAADLGQACVIRNGQLRAREDRRGTDWMLAQLDARAAPLLGDGDFASDLMDMAGDALGVAADWLTGDAPRSGLLFKAPKPGQDRRVDLPTIGPVTAQGAAAAGLAGIVIAAGGVIVLDRARVIAILDGAGMYLWVR
jgi:hypothetical protein